MSGQHVRSALCARVESLGYRWLERVRHDDLFLDEQTGHQVTLVPWPRWGRRIDVLTVLSSFPLPSGQQARAFHLDLGSQVQPDGAAVAARWRPEEAARLVESHVVPYLQRVRSVETLLDLLMDGEIRPMGSASARTVLQHGYYLAKWWQLADRVERLREVADVLSAAERVQLQHAPWGRTELAEVMWFGRHLPTAPDRAPWGLADQGDPRAELWYQQTTSEVREEAEAAETGASQHAAMHSPRAV